MARAQPAAIPLVHDPVHRVTGGAMLGCGFMLKPGGLDALRERRSHSSAVLCLRGSGTYEDADGRTWDLGPGMVFQRITGVTHSVTIHADGKWAECWVAFGPPLDAGLEAFGLFDRRRPVHERGLDVALVHAVAAAHDRLKSAAEGDLHLHIAPLVALLADLQRRPQASGRDAQRADAACRRLIADPRADLRQLARDLGLSYERFRKVFRARTGVAPGAYRQQRRIDRARELLLDERRTVQQVAAELGYPNAFAFSAQFRQAVGVPPSAWRGRQ